MNVDNDKLQINDVSTFSKIGCFEIRMIQPACRMFAKRLKN